jgi:uridine kinase
MLSGPIGAGKTTVARELIPMLRGQISYIEGDTFWSFIAKTGNQDRREDFRVIMRAMTAAALPFARSGYDVLLDFSIPPQ